MIKNLFKPSLQRLHGYVSPPQGSVRAKLNQNESPFDVPLEIKKKALARAEFASWQRYPQNESPEIRHRLAAVHDLKPEQILLGNGSNQLLLTLLSACIDRGDPIVYCPPTFGLFEIYSAVYSGAAVAVMNPPGEDAPRQQILKTLIAEKPKLVLLCTPNNPTGAEYDLNLLREICAMTPGIVLIDEAYAEFSEQSCLALLSEYKNLIVSRTFSKAFSMAGLRLGYFIADPAVIEQLAKINLPYNINIFTEMVATEVLEHRDVMLSRIRTIKEERQRMLQNLQNIPGLTVYPSAANFLLFRYEKCRQLLAFLAEAGILIRDVSSYPTLSSHARVTIGSFADNTFFYDKLLEFIGR